jgi:mRNA-degrading endonuclease toxin of MazEF toxin-antitoxin module
VARKGDILRARRRLGFIGADETLFVVLQADALNTVLPTMMVAPITSAPPGKPLPLSVPIVAPGTALPAGPVALVSVAGPQPRTRFDAAAVGAVDAATVAGLERALRLLFDL